jgi:hypothetical protein
VLFDGGWRLHATGPGDDRSPSRSPSSLQIASTDGGNLYITP